MALRSNLKKNRTAVNLYRSLLLPFVFFLRSRKAALRRAMVGPGIEALLVESRQGAFLIRPEDIDIGVGGYLVRQREYGQDEIRRIVELADANSSVLFVGTHIGALAIPVSKRVRRVTAVEANPDTFRLLEHNILLNRCTNIRALQIAASNRAETLKFVLSRANSGGSKRMPAKRSYQYFYDRPQVIEVQANRLDAMVEEPHDVIVMDIEGSESFALEGMQRLLGEARHLIVEFVPHHLRNVANVSVAQFLEPIARHFETLAIPSRGCTVKRADFERELDRMYRRGEADDGIVFSKKPAAAAQETERGTVRTDAASDGPDLRAAGD